MTSGWVPLVLPRAGAVTAALVAPPSPALDADAPGELRDQLERGLERLGRRAGEALRVDAHRVLAARRGVDVVDEPFRWTPATARRSLALGAVRRCVAGRARYPAEAVAAAVAEAVADAAAGRPRPNAPDAWLLGAGPGVRAVAQAEALRWATALWTSLEWTRFDQRPEVGFDAHFRSRSNVVHLVGRPEVRAVAASAGRDGRRRGAPDTPRPVLFCMLGGEPGPASRAQLALPALVDVLAHPGRPAPARVVGWWPDPGRALVVPVDRGTLFEALDAVLQVAALKARRPASA